MNTLQKREVEKSNFFENKKLKRLEFVVSNSCNLNCIYCYANAGTYNMQSGFISKEIILRTYEFIKYIGVEEIEQIMFFGGEPLLAVNEIEYICEVFTKERKYFPRFNIVTNLTCNVDRFIEIAKKYKFNITVSVDGPKEIHDIQRKFKDGNGTFDVILHNVKKMFENGIEIKSIESTYTKFTEEAGYSKKEIADILFAKFRQIDCIQVCNEFSDIEKVSNPDAIFFRNINLSEQEIYKLGLKKNIERKQKGMTGICEAGIKMFSVFPDGGLYPCHLFGNKMKEIANLKDDFDSIKIDFEKFQVELNGWKKQILTKCENCEYKNYCNICTAMFWENKNKFLDSDYCYTTESKVNKYV